MAYPDWLRHLVRLSSGQARTQAAVRLSRLIESLNLKTVCQSARCPNLGLCWSRGLATFLLLGDVCTRGCRFCNLRPGHPQPVDDDEPWRVLQAIRNMHLRHVVLTAVTRDDLADGGAGHFSETIRVLRRGTGRLFIEVLTPDFRGQTSSLETIAGAAPDLWGHNLETVPRLYPTIRLGADYDRSVKLLARIKDLQAGAVTKSGLMLGLGETSAEIAAVLSDLHQAGVDHLTLGQYLAPSPRHVPVDRYVPPEEFARWGQQAAALGFASVHSGPLVRSSYAGSNA
jgi:lipoyl synthase